MDLMCQTVFGAGSGGERGIFASRAGRLFSRRAESGAVPLRLPATHVSKHSSPRAHLRTRHTFMYVTISTRAVSTSASPSYHEMTYHRSAPPAHTVVRGKSCCVCCQCRPRKLALYRCMIYPSRCSKTKLASSSYPSISMLREFVESLSGSCDACPESERDIPQWPCSMGCCQVWCEWTMGINRRDGQVVLGMALKSVVLLSRML